jgi:hypothetical protein
VTSLMVAKEFTPCRVQTSAAVSLSMRINSGEISDGLFPFFPGLTTFQLAMFNEGCLVCFLVCGAFTVLPRFCDMTFTFKILVEFEFDQ